MQNYPLFSLIHIRKHREQYIKKTKHILEEQLKNIEKKITAQQNTITNYHTWRIQEEEKEYTKIIGKNIHHTELEQFKNTFTILKQRELLLEQELEELQKIKEKYLAELQVQNNALKIAQKECIKIEKHFELWQEAYKKQTEKKEEAELEEFKSQTQINENYE